MEGRGLPPPPPAPPKAPDAPAPIIDYAASFDASNPQYSINTGNANVRQIENVKAILSGPPEMRIEVDDSSTWLMVFGLGFLIYFLTRKGKR